MPVLYVIEQHHQLLELWRSQNVSNLQVVHLDFHCDMRGLFIDRRAQCAYKIGDLRQGVDQGNFLTHAIMERRVQSVRWIHHIPGGRQYDVGTVKYETDLTALPLRWLLTLNRRKGRSIRYEVLPFAEWTGLKRGEFLDIDWDFFACLDYPVTMIDRHVEAFFAMKFDWAPEQISVCYSPDFSHPSREKFEMFVHHLAQLFQAEIVRLPGPSLPEEPPPYKKYVPKPLYGLVRNSYYRTNLWFRKMGIY